MPPYEALYGRKCRSPVCWEEVGERKILGSELVQQTKDVIQLIQKRLVAAQDRQRKYADLHRKNIEFEVGRNVAYEIALPPHMQHIHNVFHVSMLKKFIPDSNQVIEYEQVEIQPDLSYVEQPIEILDRKEKVLRNRSVPIVKVLWRNPKVEEITWELESDMLEKYPHLFVVGKRVEASSDLRVLALGPNRMARRFSGYVLNGYRFHTKSRDSKCTTQNSSVFLTAETTSFACSKDDNPKVGAVNYYGSVEEIVKVDYWGVFVVVLFRCTWYQEDKDPYGLTKVNFKKTICRSEYYVIASQVQQVFYVEDPTEKMVYYVIKKLPREWCD
ncbi:hypothetical protein DCAR_0311675 [Daucus carota subsp. sativus]|uniref:DUF4216 domain-containing protein n=1 Tax=Daucus carota subsp. sativus TaxID=79200 RepID=A0AAF0WNJ3_DAUCS|nr:hypothetical protein DCAR_0311675 [Daucus carota subsp. sativus]